MLRVERTETAVPDGAADLVANLYRRLPDARITDILLEVDDATRFTEAFDATYGAGFQASDDSPHAVEYELVEDGGAFVAHRPTDQHRPRRVAFVDGTMRTEARLTPGSDGHVSMGLAGSWAAGAALVDGDNRPVSIR